MDFFRFPHTPHLAWLGKNDPRGDKLLNAKETAELLKDIVVVEEKIDGANLGISLDENGHLQVQNRGQYLLEPYSGQFSRLNAWLGQHQQVLLRELDNSLILFGEWCTAQHSLDYQALPDWFLLFDVYDRNEQKFWSTSRRNAFAKRIGLKTIFEIKRGHTDLSSLEQLVLNTPSHYRDGKIEGIVIRSNSTEWTEKRAKLVHPDFTQAIEEHWRSRMIEWNRLGEVRKKP